MDLRAKRYASEKNIYSTLKGYIDKLADFNRASWGERTVKSENIKSKILEVEIPKGASKAQIQQKNRAVRYAKEQGVELNIRVAN